MTRSRATTQQLSYAMKLANSDLPHPDCTVMVAYDKVRRSWFASYIDKELRQVGDLGEGRDPVAAVEHLIESRKVSYVGHPNQLHPLNR